MKAGDKAFFYHSGIKKPLIVGIVRIEKDPFVDTEQFDEVRLLFFTKISNFNPGNF